MASGETSSAGRATLEDVARVAGVSLATVDRVVNRREGVREKTIARVEAAVAEARLPRRSSRNAPGAQPEFPLRLHSADRQQQFHDEPDRTGRAHGGLAGRPACLHRHPSCRRVRSGRAGGSAGTAFARLCRRRHDRARSSAGARRDRRSRRSQCRGGDAGVGRAELAPHALCRHRQSRRRPHRGDADGPLPVGTQGCGRCHRWDHCRCAIMPNASSDSIRS